MSDPRRLLPILRRVTLIVSGLLVLWMVSRFRTFSLEGEAEILPLRFEPGQTLLLDTRPREPQVGDAWIVRTPGGNLALGVVRALEGERVGMEFGRKMAPAKDWLWLGRGEVRSRVLMPLPF